MKYIMVGGVAINFSGYQRSTEDVDVWLKDTKGNREKFRKAFEEYSGENYYMITTTQCLKLAGLADIDDVLVPF